MRVFRHRRGRLEELELRSSLAALAHFVAPKLEELMGPLVQPLALWSVDSGIALGLVTDTAALAFELAWAPHHGDARFVVGAARGVGLPAPALGHALRACDAALGRVFTRRGRLLVLERAVHRSSCAVLPAIGARVPAADHCRFGALEAEGDGLSIAIDSTHPPPALAKRVVRELELAELTADADDALARGELDQARAGYLLALEKAPRHPEIVRLVAEIDVAVGGRAEAALGMIVESIPATVAGLVGGELLARVGDLDGAREAISVAVSRESYAPLAALSLLRLAELELSAPERVGALDRAVAAAPGLPLARWKRFESRVARSEIEGAIADAEHLEAAASGARARHDVCVRAARALLEAGFGREAGRVFERALRYVPDDASATAGLARALLEAGRSERAYALLARAVTLTERSGKIDTQALIDMARLLANEMRDLPQAIARVRQVPASAEQGPEARALEAGWRAALGDIAGASLAYARLRDALELATQPPAAACEWLLGAARFEREVQRDALAAERHLALAMRLDPHDPEIASAYREVAGLVAARARRQRDELAAQATGAESDSRDSEPGEAFERED